MKNIEMIQDIFDKTNKIASFWTTFGEEYTENPQTSHILNYLCLTACYLKSEEEAKYFKEKWTEIKDSLKSGSDCQDWLNQSNMIRSHLEQALKEEGIHNPKDSRNLGIKRFYEDKFSSLYLQAKKEYDAFQEKQEESVKAIQAHYAEVFATQKSWEAAVKRGDPLAWVD